MKKTFLFAAFLISFKAHAQNANIKVVFDQQDAKRKLSLSRPLHRTQFPELDEVEEITVNNGIIYIRS